MYYLCFIYVLSMYYLKMGTKWEPNGYKTGTGHDHEAKNRS